MHLFEHHRLQHPGRTSGSSITIILVMGHCTCLIVIVTPQKSFDELQGCPASRKIRILEILWFMERFIDTRVVNVIFSFRI